MTGRVFDAGEQERSVFRDDHLALEGISRTPMSVIFIPSPSTMRITSPLDAPSATRMPLCAAR
jgi:hypothetical protein